MVVYMQAGFKMTDQTVYANMQILASFVVGDKPLMNKESGLIVKDDRYLQAMQRALFGGFDPECVERTFERSNTMITSLGASNKKINKESLPFRIYGLYMRVIAGVKNIAKTYEDLEKKATAKRLIVIADKYFEGFRTLPDLQKKTVPAKKLRGALNSFSRVEVRPATDKRDDFELDVKRSSKRELDLEGLDYSRSDSAEYTANGDTTIKFPARQRNSKDKNLHIGPYVQTYDEGDKKKEKKNWFLKLFCGCC
jgi:hypothetical protein